LIPLTLDQVAELCEGTLEAAPGAREITGVEIDSRRVSPSDLFVAIGGGVDYVEDAFEHGAAAALVPADAFAAMGALGRAVRDRSDATVVAITGAMGKTSTRDILAALCRPHMRTVAAEASQNNEIGLPLTLTRIESDTEVVITEMGMRGLGQIAQLCELARPHVGVVTGIAPVHLELVGTVERVAEAKAEVIASLPADGVAVVPAEAAELEPFLRSDVRTLRFGAGGDVTLARFEPPTLLAEVAGQPVELEVPFTARYQAVNTLAALAAYHALGLPLAEAGRGAGAIELSRWRGEELELPGGGVLINDAYNANPVSMRAALDHLVERAAGRRRVAVLGDMAELGSDAPEYHREIGSYASTVGVDVLLAVGPLAAEFIEGQVEIPVTRHVGTVEDGIRALEDLLQPGDCVLVKASRALGLERVADAVATALPA
jgi:UDP-N-acetylmuramoyl-tripeptide--D-alanyl-D-alanine ligase